MRWNDERGREKRRIWHCYVCGFELAGAFPFRKVWLFSFVSRKLQLFFLLLKRQSIHIKKERKAKATKLNYFVKNKDEINRENERKSSKLEGGWKHSSYALALSPSTASKKVKNSWGDKLFPIKFPLFTFYA